MPWGRTCEDFFRYEVPKRSQMVTSKLAASVVKKIFATDKRIGFCALVDANGRLEAGGMRPGVRSLEPKEETAKIVTRMFLTQSMNQAADPFLGRANWVIVRRESLVQITFPLPAGEQLQITATLEYPISKVANLAQFVNQLATKK